MIEVATRFAAVPITLRELDQWVVWCYEQRGDKTTKVPYNPQDGSKASSTNMQTWNTFALCCRALDEHPTAYNGIGFMFKKGGGIFGFDGDHLYDPATGTIAPEAKAWLDRFATYTELSPGGHGIHAIGFGTLPGKGKKREPFEVYDQERYFTITGNHVPGYPTTLAQVNGALTDLWEHLAKGTNEAPINPVLPHEGTSVLTDSEVLDLADSAKNSAKFRDLWSGGMAGHASASSADLALCTMLAFWCRKDADQMDRLFRQSGLMRDKWDERRGGSFYRELTIDKAIALTGEVYEKPEPSPVFIPAKKTRNEYDQKVDEDTGEVLEDEETDEPNTGGGRAKVYLSNKWIRTNVADCLTAIVSGNEPNPAVFVQGRTLVRIVRTRHGMISEAYSIHSLRTRLSECANLFRYDGRTKKQAKADASDTLVQGMLAEAHWDLPELDGIIEVPIFREDGTILETPGYDTTSRLFYEPAPNLHIPAIPAHPSTEDVSRAIGLFDDILADFPFSDELTGRAHSLALLLTPFVREMIAGPTPLVLIDAPGPGSGKGLLADMLCMPAFGPIVGNLGECGEDSEWRKQITSVLLGSTRVVRIDNIADVVDSPSLARALTTLIWEDRVLGGNKIARVPVRCTWIGTGNNVTTSSEISRRIVPIRIDPNDERPQDRKGFKHDNLRLWARTNRGSLIAAALTLIRAWHNDGQRSGTVAFGSYEEWSAVLGGILDFAGIDGFLANMQEPDEAVDAELMVWQEFIQGWWGTHKQRLVLTKDLLDLAWQSNIPLRSTSPHAQKVELGMAIRKQRGRVIAGKKVVCKRNSDTKVMGWWLNPDPHNKGVVPDEEEL